MVGAIDLARGGLFYLGNTYPPPPPSAIAFWIIPVAAAIAVTVLTGWRRTPWWRAWVAASVAALSAIAWIPAIAAWISFVVVFH